ncbi:hypothetical protein Dsin_023484 [Dipteronia sinensis]|uniref:Uncharacterized protein n=1 Tax=Dipteronia sinensis TaxID=43782 RepID=A0AAE0A4I8_9ROSI|nr:hypothetical protein Dsin_023484 [Dipteronia sinensis]
MWHILLERFPNEDSLAKTGLSLASSCRFCYASTETLAHLFLHCPYSHSLWDYFSSLLEFISIFQLSPLDFFISAISWKASPQVGNLWLKAVVQIFWATWYARNPLIFKDCFIPLISSIAFIHTTLKDCNRLNIGGMHNKQSDLLLRHRLQVRPRLSRAPRIIEIYWRPPPLGWIKVNKDGACLGSPGPSSCCGVFRNHRGFVKGCFASPLGIMHAFEAELSVVIKAIEYAFGFGWHNLWIECDSSYMVSLLSCRSPNVPWRFLSSWRRCLVYLTSMKIFVSHIYREGNQVGNSLASHGLSLAQNS